MGYRYDPDLAPVVAQLPRRDLTDLTGTRAAVAAAAAARAAVDTTGVLITDEVLPTGVGVRVYRPAKVGGPTGAILHAHGGGFVMCDVESSHPRNVELVRKLGVPLVSVDYRLAPEHPYPAALQDVFTALEWLASAPAGLAVDPTRIVLHGTSAGAGLVAAAALLARDRGGPAVRFQYLGIPMLDDRQDTASIRRFTDTPMWDRDKAAIAWSAYLGQDVAGGADVDVYAAPARATDLRGLPPAYVNVMEFDPLRDEGLNYALALLAAEVPVEVHLFPGTFHGASMFPQAAIVRREAAEEVAVLRGALAPVPDGDPPSDAPSAALSGANSRVGGLL